MPQLVLVQDHLITWAAVLAALGVIITALWKPLKAVKDFLAHWNGAPEKKDWAGNTISDPKPGILAMVQEISDDLVDVRAQVKNHHPTNLRDDVTKLQSSIAQIDKKLDAHIQRTEDSIPLTPHRCEQEDRHNYQPPPDVQ